MGKTSESINGSFSIAFSIAMLVYQRVINMDFTSHGDMVRFAQLGGHVPAFYHRGGEGIPVPW